MLTVNELFSGIGSQRAALKRLGIEHKVVGIAEIDKFAIKSYEAIWGPTKNYGDISKVNKLDYADFWTYSFPCQDISVAGKQAGIKHGKTRSGLLYEVERLLEVARQHNELPKYLMLENVKNLVGKKFKPQFEEWIERLDELGYNTYWQVLNAKHYGIPQNRERVFGISIRKDIDTGYVFPEPFELKTRLKDILEDEVDEKYYINNEKANKLIRRLSDTNQLVDEINPCDGTINEPKVKDISNCIKARYDCGVSNQRSDGTMIVETILWGGEQKNQSIKTDGVSTCLTSSMGTGGGYVPMITEPSINQVGMLDIKGNEQVRRVYGDNGISPTLNTMQGGNRQPKVLISQATKKGHIECNIPGVADLSFPDSKTRRGRVQEDGEICPTLTAGQQDICYMEPVRAASRGRNPNNPSDRTVGSPTEQRLEINQNSTSNTITTVQKDNYVLEPMENDQEYINNISDEYKFTKSKCQEMFGSNGCLPEMFNPYNKAEVTEIAPTQTTMCGRSCSSATVLIKQPQFRIRKLTPKECWILMGFTDEQFQKAQDAGVSNSQLYKQAGNSIVVDVLYYIFRNLFIEKPKYRVQVDSEEQIPGQASILDFM